MYVLLEPWTLELIQDAGAGSGISTEDSYRTPSQLRLNELALILPLFGEDQRADSGYGGYRA